VLKGFFIQPMATICRDTAHRSGFFRLTEPRHLDPQAGHEDEHRLRIRIGDDRVSYLRSLLGRDGRMGE
jgi:hypothetical protein